jgi:sodium-coupled neutral amino acid transporter 11
MDQSFGPAGRAAISFFQFAFAFGGESWFRRPRPSLILHQKGMCAFGIIIGTSGMIQFFDDILTKYSSVGDTIPHVIRAAFPRIQSTPVLSIFSNRSFIVALCTICVSYPLSLYKDIAKLARASGLALIGMMIIVVSVVIEGEHVTDALKGDPSKRFSLIGSQVFEAIGVIRYGHEQAICASLTDSLEALPLFAIIILC